MQPYDVTPGREFYVTVKRSMRTGWLLGPYYLHSEALDNVERARQLAYKHDPWTAFDAFGTASLPEGSARPTIFGK